MKSGCCCAWKLLPTLTALTLLLVLGGCAQNPVSGRPNFVTMSEDQEVQTGRQEDAKVRQEYGVYGDKALQRYVNEVGQRMGKVSHRPTLQYSYVVVDSPEINAFALPGGYIYITRGILSYLNSEAELAAVLGHETGHVTARHSVQQMGAATAASVGATLLGVFVPVLRNQVGDTAVNLLGSALLSGYGREHELEADRLAAEYLLRTGYDPQAMIKVVGALKNQELFDAAIAKSEGREPRAYHGLFASHPDNDTRLQEVVAQAGRLPPGAGRVNQDEFMRMIDRLPFGSSESQGFVRNFVFYHRELDLAVKFPEHWRISNTPVSVSAKNQTDDAVIQMRLAGRAQGAPADVLRKAVGGAADVTATTINGLPAAVTTTTVRGNPTRAAVIFLHKNAYIIAGQASSGAALQQALPEINATIAGFHAMTDTERNSVRPLTLRIITAPAGATFAELAKHSPLGKNAVARLRLLNALYPDGEPVAGQALKIIE